MDTLKGVVGLGGKKEEGQEPVSGAKGEGTTAEPFDAGNKESTTQAADQTEDSNASKSEPPAPSTSAEEKDMPPAKEEKKSGFLGVFGLGGKKKQDGKDTQAGAEQAVDKEEAQKHLPPNHLGSTVPEGVSTDLADPGTVAPGQTDGLAAERGTTAAAPVTPDPSQDDSVARSPSTSVGKQPDRGASQGSIELPDRSRLSPGGVGGATALPGSRGEHRGSMIPPDAPKYKRVENPDRIPVAGGKKIGEEQYQTRRASVAPSSSLPRDMPKLDHEGSPDPVIASNTEANVAPTSTAASAAVPHIEGKNTAPQQMKEFSMGDASKEAEAKPDTGAAATEDVAPDEGAGGVGLKKTTSSSSPSAGKEHTEGGHKRRGSVFDKLKSKLKGNKSDGSK